MIWPSLLSTTVHNVLPLQSCYTLHHKCGLRASIKVPCAAGESLVRWRGWVHTRPHTSTHVHTHVRTHNYCTCPHLICPPPPPICLTHIPNRMYTLFLQPLWSTHSTAHSFVRTWCSVHEHSSVQLCNWALPSWHTVVKLVVVSTLHTL